MTSIIITISLAKKADLCVIAPTTANVLAKLAEGIADDMLTTTVLAMKCPIVVAPAMNTNMYENPITQQNINALKKRGFIFVDPVAGRLACGDTGVGKMAEPIDIVSKIVEVLIPKQLTVCHARQPLYSLPCCFDSPCCITIK